MKKSFILFSILILVFVFSILAVKIYETQSITSINIINKYKYVQGKNHLMFLQEYMKSIDDYSSIEKISIEDKDFIINGFVFEEGDNYKIQLLVKANDYNIRLYKELIIEK